MTNNNFPTPGTYTVCSDRDGVVMTDGTFISSKHIKQLLEAGEAGYFCFKPSSQQIGVSTGLPVSKTHCGHILFGTCLSCIRKDLKSLSFDDFCAKYSINKNAKMMIKQDKETNDKQSSTK